MITIQGGGNSVAILNGNIDLPLSGVWNTGTLVLNTASTSGFEPGDSVSIVDDNGLTFNGIAAPDRSGLFIETLHIRVIGGKNGMDKTPTPKQFSKATVSDVINSLISDSGESLSNTVDQSLMQKSIGNWTVFASTVRTALATFLAFVDPTINWRILPDGTLWFGTENWNTYTDQTSIWKNGNPTDKSNAFGVDGLKFGAGVTYANQSQNFGKIARVVHEITPDTLTTKTWNEVNGEERGIEPTIRKYINLLTDKQRFFGLYVGNVVSQTSDYTKVDIQAIDNRVPSMSGIKLTSGQYYKIDGEQVLYGWIGGDPSQPFAFPFINAGATNFVALANLVNNNMMGIQNGLNTHIHLAGSLAAPPGGGAVTGVSGAATPDGYYSPSDVSASKVKAE